MIHVTFSERLFGNIHVSSGPIGMQVDWDMTRYRMRKVVTYCITRRWRATCWSKGLSKKTHSAKKEMTIFSQTKLIIFSGMRCWLWAQGFWMTSLKFNSQRVSSLLMPWCPCETWTYFLKGRTGKAVCIMHCQTGWHGYERVTCCKAWILGIHVQVAASSKLA